MSMYSTPINRARARLLNCYRVYGFGGMERWNGMVEWTGMDWNGLEWNDRSTNFVGVAKLCPRQFQYPALSA